MRVRVALVAAVALSDCLDPTEIRVVVSTDVACSQVNSTAIAAGKPGDDTNYIAGKTTACSPDGGIGVLVVTPSHGIDDDVAIRVTMGLNGTSADGCVAPKFEGCIVARRSLRYDPHTPLTLPIEMQQACFDNSCDPNSTCINGSCVDAGLTCDEAGTCAIDAGLPDVGVPDAPPPCGIAPKLVVPVTAQVTPHLVQTATGWAIGWETATLSDPSRAYEVTPLDAQGNPGKPVSIVAQLAPGASVGPLGTDGTNFAATFVPQNSAYGYREIDPNGNALHVNAAPGSVQLGRAGMFYDTAGWAFALIDGTNGPTFAYWPFTGVFGTISVSTPGTNDIALAHFNGHYYAGYHDSGTCYIATAQLTPPTFITGTTSTYSACTTVRVTENAPGTDLVVTREGSGGSNTFSLVVRPSMSSNVAPVPIDSVDDQAIVALAGTGKQFHIVYGLSPDVLETTIDTSTLTFTTPIKIASGTGFNLQPTQGIGFDAIAEPNSMAHDVAYWASAPQAGIYFTRICN
jgi:hypothetical protein